jgi:hypothetical protein
MSALLAFLNSLAAVGVGMGEVVKYGWRREKIKMGTNRPPESPKTLRPQLEEFPIRNRRQSRPMDPRRFSLSTQNQHL